jgi:peptidoglycan/LPS O-acetylase OafA/YrhL
MDDGRVVTHDKDETKWLAGAATIDAVAVAIFVVIGRASHDHGESPAGIVSTLWPFACGVAVGWLLVRLARRPPASIWSGVVVCVATVAVGMVLRVVAGQGTAAAFIVVATAFLGAAMVGGRLAARLAARWTARRRLGGQG